jgi:2-polyprenyl-3-methyl-5-hydroxy-6-metoxy-1,4-benzoquinol methylase
MATTVTTQFETTACSMCGASSASLLFEGGDLLHPSTEQFRLMTCQVCGHIYQNPRPTVATIGKYYPDDYIPFQRAIEDEPDWWRRFDRHYGRYRRCMTVHRASGGPGRLLDVGCATGIFLDGMRQLGWQVQGVELMTSAAQYARTRFGLDVFCGELEAANFPMHRFDAITLWDVLEHVHEPRALLTEVARLLKPGGLLVLSLPNPDSLEARLLGHFWLGWDLPRHLNLFRPQLLTTQLAKHGLCITTIRSFTAGYAVLVMSLEHRLRAAGSNSHRIIRVLNSPLLRLLAKLYYDGPANWYNLSSIMVVFAKRDSEIR